MMTETKKEEHRDRVMKTMRESEVKMVCVGRSMM